MKWLSGVDEHAAARRVGGDPVRVGSGGQVDYRVQAGGYSGRIGAGNVLGEGTGQRVPAVRGSCA